MTTGGWSTLGAAGVAIGLSLAAVTVARGQSTPGPGPAPAVGVRVGSDGPESAAATGGRGRRAEHAGMVDDTVIAAGTRRQQLEQRLQQRLEEVVRQRLGLTDDQLRRLRVTNQRFAGQRRALGDREREVRRAMRAELNAGAAADQDRVAALADSLFAIQRQRLDLLQSEQRELAGYLTPVQRVRFYGLQEQLHRRLEQMRQRRQAIQP